MFAVPVHIHTLIIRAIAVLHIFISVIFGLLG